MSRSQFELVRGEQLDAWVENCVADKLKQRSSASDPDFLELMLLRLECLADYDKSRR